MNDLITRLAQARSIHAQYKTELGELEQEIQEVVQERYGHKLERRRSLLSTAKDDLDDAETLVRQAALDNYAREGTKKPHAAVQIKLYTVLDYDPGEAIKLALPGTLKLDKKAFEKVAKVMPIDFVTIGKEPRATVAKDLSRFKSEAA